MPSPIRAFIAVPLDPIVRDTIAQTQAHLQQVNADVKWVIPGNIHLTLKFIGPLPEKKIPAVKEALRAVVSPAPNAPERPPPHPRPTIITSPLTGLGAFPSLQRPRVFWIGLNDADQKIAALANAIETALAALGFQKENRIFKPHLTIGRVRSQKRIKSLTQKISDYAFPTDLTQTISDFALIKSTLTSTGPIYETLESFSFKKKNEH